MTPLVSILSQKKAAECFKSEYFSLEDSCQLKEHLKSLKKNQDGIKYKLAKGLV